jgi:hypothetical protein
MTTGRRDPGDCLICGAAHCSCGDDRGPIVVDQLPQRDAAAALETTAQAAAIQATLPPESFTTGSYRGDKDKKRR